MNGCNLTWPQWNKWVGSVLCIEMGKDIGLSDTEAPGLLGVYQLQMTGTFNNITSSTINYTAYIVTISEGTFTLTENTAITQIGILTKSDVFNARNKEYVDYGMLRTFAGKGFLGDVAKGLKAANSFVNKSLVPGARSLSRTVSNVRNALSDIRGEHGFGDSYDDDDGDYLGNGVVGGAKMTRSHLKHRMHRV